MNVIFKIKDTSIGSKDVWDYREKSLSDETYLMLDDGDKTKELGDKVLLCDVVTDYRNLAREEPIFTELIKIPSDLCIVEELLYWWDEAPEDWRKSFVYLYQELGDYSTQCAMRGASEIVWTGVKYNEDSPKESFEALGRYYAGRFGVTGCLEYDKAFDYAKFGTVQTERLSGRLVPCLTFGEWIETDDYSGEY